MSTQKRAAGGGASKTTESASKPPKKVQAKRTATTKPPTKKPLAKKAAAKKVTESRPGKILVWMLHFPASDPDSSAELTPSLTASVTLEDGEVVWAKAASAIDYRPGVISRDLPVQVRYEGSDDEAPDDPKWVFDLIDATDSSS
jgi:hypothetical protein